MFGFKKKEKIEDDPTLDMKGLPGKPVTVESATMENIKAKIDLNLTQLDSLRTQYESMNERIKNIEKLIKEIYLIAKS